LRLGIVEKWRMVASLLDVGEGAARSMCKRFGVDLDERVMR